MVVIPPSGVRLLCTLPVYILSNCGTLYVGRSLWFALQCHEDNMVAFGSIALAVFVPFETVKCSIFSRHTPYCKSIHPHPIHPRPCSSKTPCVKYGPNPVRCKPDIIVQHQINRFMQVLSEQYSPALVLAAVCILRADDTPLISPPLGMYGMWRCDCGCDASCCSDYDSSSYRGPSPAGGSPERSVSCWLFPRKHNLPIPACTGTIYR